MALCSKTKINAPRKCKVLYKDTIKYDCLPHLPVSKRGYVSKTTRRKSFNAFSTSGKRAVNGRLFLRLHDAVFVGREQHGLQTVALALISVRVFRVVAHARVCGTIIFV